MSYCDHLDLKPATCLVLTHSPFLLMQKKIKSVYRDGQWGQKGFYEEILLLIFSISPAVVAKS